MNPCTNLKKKKKNLLLLKDAFLAASICEKTINSTTIGVFPKQPN